MQESTVHINRIHKKLVELLRKYEQLDTGHAKLTTALAASKEQNSLLQEEVAELTQQNLILKASLQSMEEKDKKALELKINSFVKSLDKTIALLSQ